MNLMLKERSTVISGWGVHVLTLTGVIWATLAVVAILTDEAKLMWLFLGIAMFTDGIDGPLARKFDVKNNIPGFDGSILDIIVDYLTWSFIPALFLFTTGLAGGPVLSTLTFMIITVSSMFCYANVGMKTNDNYFMGFPAAWNLVVLYLWILGTPVWLTFVTVALFAILTLMPLTFLHPFRVKKYRALNLVAVGVWLLTTFLLVLEHPSMPLVTQIPWWISGAWILLAGFLRKPSKVLN